MVQEGRLIDELREYVEKISAIMPVTHAILFGSRARGDARPDSDADLLIVSPSFTGKTVVGRTLPLRKRWDLDYSVDFLCYDPAEFAALRDRVSIVRVALDEGVTIAS